MKQNTPDILSGIDYVAEDLEEQLNAIGWPDTSAERILLDRPIGWVTLENQRPLICGALVITDNNCPEYLREISVLRPLAIINKVTAQAIANLGDHPTDKTVPNVKVSLSPSEGNVLKLVAEGNSNKRIARLRDVSEGTVENALVSIHRKLQLKTRVELTHYYYGNWHLLAEPYSAHIGRG